MFTKSNEFDHFGFTLMVYLSLTLIGRIVYACRLNCVSLFNLSRRESADLSKESAIVQVICFFVYLIGGSDHTIVASSWVDRS